MPLLILRLLEELQFAERLQILLKLLLLTFLAVEVFLAVFFALFTAQSLLFEYLVDLLDLVNEHAIDLVLLLNGYLELAVGPFDFTELRAQLLYFRQGARECNLVVLDSQLKHLGHFGQVGACHHGPLRVLLISREDGGQSGNLGSQLLHVGILISPVVQHKLLEATL